MDVPFIQENQVQFTQEVLGSGSTGIVLKAFFNGKAVAIKQFFTVNALQDELEILTRLAECPRVCQVLGRVGDKSLMLEYVEMNLERFLHKEIDLGLSRYDIAIGIAKALVDVHNTGHLHGNLSMSCILLDRQGIKLTGFGGSLPNGGEMDTDKDVFDLSAIFSQLTNQPQTWFHDLVAKMGHSKRDNRPTSSQVLRILEENTQIEQIRTKDPQQRDLISLTTTKCHGCGTLVEMKDEICLSCEMVVQENYFEKLDILLNHIKTRNLLVDTNLRCPVCFNDNSILADPCPECEYDTISTKEKCYVLVQRIIKNIPPAKEIPSHKPAPSTIALQATSHVGLPNTQTFVAEETLRDYDGILIQRGHFEPGYSLLRAKVAISSIAAEQNFKISCSRYAEFEGNNKLMMYLFAANGEVFFDYTYKYLEPTTLTWKEKCDVALFAAQTLQFLNVHKLTFSYLSIDSILHLNGDYKLAAFPLCGFPREDYRAMSHFLFSLVNSSNQPSQLSQYPSWYQHIYNSCASDNIGSLTQAIAVLERQQQLRTPQEYTLSNTCLRLNCHVVEVNGSSAMPVVIAMRIGDKFIEHNYDGEDSYYTYNFNKVAAAEDLITIEVKLLIDNEVNVTTGEGLISVGNIVENIDIDTQSVTLTVPITTQSSNGYDIILYIEMESPKKKLVEWLQDCLWMIGERLMNAQQVSEEEIEMYMKVKSTLEQNN